MKIWQISLVALLISSLGCSQATSSSESESVPESESDKNGQEPATAGHALPATGGGGAGVCGEEEREGYYRPSLDAWAQAAESIFVGTIRSVTRHPGPVYHLDSNEFLGEIDPADCPVPVLYGVVMEFEDVETLRGEPVGDTLRLELSYKLLDSLEVFFDEDSQGLVDGRGEQVYFAGARIGSALFTAETGHKFWAYSQFEVLDDTVHLQPTQEEGRCWTAPHVLEIPPSYEGVSFAEFVQAIDQADGPLNQDALDHLERHEAFLAAERNAATFGNVCSHGPIARPEPDPAEKNDPDL